MISPIPQTGFDQYTQRIDNIFTYYLAQIPEQKLRDSMAYMLGNAGKRIRPLFIYTVGQIFAADLAHLDIPAAAIEMVHTYSLIHDDLPCMDNADLRRGKPSCHKAFDEATAVLAGDALLTLAFQILSESEAITPEKRVAMIQLLSFTSGCTGMVAGQMLDLCTLPDISVTSEILFRTYRLKTGMLLEASILLGWLTSNDNNLKNKFALQKFGNLIGLAFQIQDDLIDMQATSAISGKPQGLDQNNNKITYPRLVGMDQARMQVEQLFTAALAAIACLGPAAKPLHDLCNELLIRKK